MTKKNDEFEKIRDDIAKKLREAERRRGVTEGQLDKSCFNPRDLGIRRIEEVYNGYDHGASSFEIQKAIDKAADFNISQRENRVNKFLSKVASNGFYGYLKLRKLLGLPKESFRVKPWYAQKLDASLALINPGGIVKLSEGTFSNSTKITIKQKVGLVGTRPQATILKPTADINTIEIKPSVALGESGIGVSVENLKIYDEDSETSTKAAIVLDGTDKHTSNVLMQHLLIEDYYDGIKNNPLTSEGDLWSQDLWCWHHTIKDVTLKGFKHYGIKWQNVADIVHSNIWLLSTASSVSAVYMEKLANASLKMGGNMFQNFRIFNENIADTAHGFWLKDYGEAWFNNVIVESVGISFYLQGCFSLFMNQCWGVGYPPDGMLKEGFRLDPVEESQFVNCHAHDNGLEGFNLRGKTQYNTFVNCTAKNNSRVAEENKHGFLLWGLGTADLCRLNRLVSCKAYDDQDTPTQYGGIGERDAYTDYNIIVAPITFGNTNVTVNVEGAHSQVAWSNELQPDKTQSDTTATDASGDKTVTFPIEFTNTPLVLVQSKDSSGRGVVFDVTAISTTQFTVKAHRTNTLTVTGDTGSPSSTVSASQIALGQCPDGHEDCKVTMHSTVTPASALHSHEIDGSATAAGVAADFIWYAIPQQS